MAAHHTVGHADVLARPWRRALERDAIVVAVGHHAGHHHVVTTVKVEGIVVVVVAVEHLDVGNPHPVARQVMLHPAT